MSGSFETRVREEARYIMLRTLCGEPSYSLVDALLQLAVEPYGIMRSREWINAELRYLSDIGAVTLVSAGGNLIATLTQRGRDHVERRAILDGVKRPSSEA